MMNTHSAYRRSQTLPQHTVTAQPFPSKQRGRIGLGTARSRPLRQSHPLSFSPPPPPPPPPPAVRAPKLYWSPIPRECLGGTVWEKLDSDGPIEIDSKHFALQFQVRPSTPSSARHRERGAAAIPTARRQQILSVLIALGLEPEELRSAVLNVDGAVLTAQRLALLMSAVPSLEEQRLSEGIDAAATTDKVELFLFSMRGFYGLGDRLRRWRWMQSFDENVDSMMAQYAAIESAADVLSNDRSLRLLLRIILALGNRLNATTTTKGFDVRALPKMASITSCDGTRSLLMALYDFCEREHPEAVAAVPALSAVLRAANDVDVDSLRRQTLSVRRQMAEIERFLGSEEVEQFTAGGDRFVSTAAVFHKMATLKMKRFRRAIDGAVDAVNAVLRAYRFGADGDGNESSNFLSIGSFFEIWTQFLSLFGASKGRLMAIKRQRRRRMTERRKRDRARGDAFCSRNVPRAQRAARPPRISLHRPQLQQQSLSAQPQSLQRATTSPTTLRRESRKRRSNTMEDLGDRSPTPSTKEVQKRRNRLASLEFTEPNQYSFPPPPPDPKQSLSVRPALSPLVHSNPMSPNGNGQRLSLRMHRDERRDSFHREPPQRNRQSLRHENHLHFMPPQPPLFISQSSSGSVFAEIEDGNMSATEWRQKYEALKARYDRLEWTKQRNRELQQTVDRLVSRERERERASRGRRAVRFKERVSAMNRTLSGFNEDFSAEKLGAILDDETDPLVVGYEVKRLQSANVALGGTLEGITAFIDNKAAPDVARYDDWDLNEVMAWIKTLDGGRYISYCNVLRACLQSEGVFGGGSLMVMDDPDDLKEEPWRIRSEADRVGLIRHFQSLPALKSQMAKAQ